MFYFYSELIPLYITTCNSTTLENKVVLYDDTIISRNQDFSVLVFPLSNTSVHKELLKTLLISLCQWYSSSILTVLDMKESFLDWINLRIQLPRKTKLLFLFIYYFCTLSFYTISSNIPFLNIFIRLRRRLNISQRAFMLMVFYFLNYTLRISWKSLQFFSISCKNWKILENESYFSS